MLLLSDSEKKYINLRKVKISKDGVGWCRATDRRPSPEPPPGSPTSPSNRCRCQRRRGAAPGKWPGRALAWGNTRITSLVSATSRNPLFRMKLSPIQPLGVVAVAATCPCRTRGSGGGGGTDGPPHTCTLHHPPSPGRRVDEPHSLHAVVAGIPSIELLLVEL